MATSSKVSFKLEKLQEDAVKSIDDQIAAKVLVVESYDDEAALAQRRAEWRTAQEERVSHLFSRLGGADLSDEELADFKIQPRPKVDSWDRIRAEAELQTLRAQRGKVIAKSGALVADKDGNIALTKTQLQEFFLL